MNSLYDVLHREVFGIPKPAEIPDYIEEPEHKYCKWCEEMIYKQGSNFCSARCEAIFDSQPGNRLGIDRLNETFYYKRDKGI